MRRIYDMRMVSSEGGRQVFEVETHLNWRFFLFKGEFTTTTRHTVDGSRPGGAEKPHWKQVGLEIRNLASLR